MSNKAGLQEVSDQDIPKLLQLLRCDLPDGIHACAFVETLSKWRKKDPSMSIHFLAPRGNYRSGVFFYITYDDRMDGSFYAWTPEGRQQLAEGLANTDINWADYKLLFTCMHENTWDVIYKTMQPKWESNNKIRISYDNVYWLPWQEAKEKQVKIPDDTMYIEDLKPEHAELINSVWPHKFKGSEQFISKIIKLNFGLGLFMRGDGSLVSWAVHWFYGGIGAVQTLEEHKRKGCGAAVVAALTRRLGHQGVDVHANVVGGNAMGNLLFNKLGYRHAFNSVWAYGTNYVEG